MSAILLQCIAVIANSEALGLPGFVTKYNGKPVLINRSGHCEEQMTHFSRNIEFLAEISL